MLLIDPGAGSGWQTYTNGVHIRNRDVDLAKGHDMDWNRVPNGFVAVTKWPTISRQQAVRAF